jgi:hypothetical protein
VEQCPAFDPSRAVVLFPSDDATLVGDLDFSSVERVFIVDSRWWVDARAARSPCSQHTAAPPVACSQLPKTGNARSPLPRCRTVCLLSTWQWQQAHAVSTMALLSAGRGRDDAGVTVDGKGITCGSVNIPPLCRTSPP